MNNKKKEEFHQFGRHLNDLHIINLCYIQFYLILFSSFSFRDSERKINTAVTI